MSKFIFEKCQVLACQGLVLKTVKTVLACQVQVFKTVKNGLVRQVQFKYCHDCLGISKCSLNPVVIVKAALTYQNTFLKTVMAVLARQEVILKTAVTVLACQGLLLDCRD
jgi:hypothetical protein